MIAARGAWRANAPSARTGEVLGLHTVAELRDMVAATKYEMLELLKAGHQCGAWQTQDPAAFKAWQDKLQALASDLAPMAAAAQTIIDTVPDALEPYTPAGPLYGHFLDWRKRFAAVDEELRLAGHCGAVYDKMPQPTARDPDRETLIASQKATRAVEGAARTVFYSTAWGAIFLAVGLGVGVILARR